MPQLKNQWHRAGENEIFNSFFQAPLREGACFAGKLVWKENLWNLEKSTATGARFPTVDFFTIYSLMR